MLPALRALSNEREMRVSEIRERVAIAERISPRDLQERGPSGRETKFATRTLWALTHLLEAGLVSRMRRGIYAVTDQGRKLLDGGCSHIDLNALRKHSGFAEQSPAEAPAQQPSGGHNGTHEEPTVSPEEVLDQAARTLHSALEAELLELVRGAGPAFLEQVVVDLLIAMGYGGGDTSMGRVTGRSADGGIDGKIKEDRLGLDEVYVQAKRYAAGNPVGEPELRSFAGAIDASGTTKGVFVTTSAFTRQAEEYVRISPKRIVLIDGEKLVRLMVRNDVGVRTKTTIQIKRVDQDYFDPED